MPITLDTFKAVANSTAFSSRGIIVQGEGKAATAKLGNFIFSQGKAANNATMAAFKEALENEYGSLGTHAFDTVLGAREATGLKNLSTILGAGKTSIEDQIKKGLLGAGMSVNRSEANNILLEKIKTNGVEPGFIYRNDWSPDDTRGMMADINSDESRHALDVLKQNDPAFAAKCEGKSLRDQIMLAGRAHPAGMAAVAEFAIMEAAGFVKSGHTDIDHSFAPLAKALKNHFTLQQDIDALASGKADKRLLTEVKRELFAQIRDAVMGVKKDDDFYGFSPIFNHFEDRHIMKLDYNEGDRVRIKDAAHAGSFQRPERILTTRKPILGQIYRLQTAHSADSISAGAVTEALANDLTRVAGVPAQELQIVRGEYSDGHPKLMLQAKFADGYKDAKIYRPVPYVAPKADPRPLMDPATLPDVLDVPVEYGGKTLSVKIPKTHFADLVTTRSSVHRPRNIDELRFLLESQIKRGNEVLGALMSGRSRLFEPTRENIVALTYAVHVAALRKGEYMYRGSFSIEDPNGDIARWLDWADDVYLRTSTHAKPYQEMNVDGHVNMPRGYDVPTGAGGLLNGMRTFHYFTIPDTRYLQNAGGSGPKRRLFLKCETFGIFASTAHFHPFKKADAMSDGMKTRGYRPGDILESIQHGASLFKSFFTPKEAPGIRKENLTAAQKRAIRGAKNKLEDLGLGSQGEILVAGAVLDGGGIKILSDNVGFILEKMMPEDEEKRAALMSVFDELVYDFADATTAAGGEITNRIGNEIMIDAKDLA